MGNSLTEIEYPGKYVGTKPPWLTFEVDVCETSIVGGQKLSLLRRLPLKTSNEISRLAFNPYYDIPLRQQEFDTIHVFIKDPTGKTASFAAGVVTCTLHLKQITKPQHAE